jgi:hypothetical protein
LFNDGEFFVRQLAWLLQYSIGNSDLADVMQKRPDSNLIQLFVSRLQRQRRCARERAHPVPYYAGESISGIGRRLGMTRLSVSKWVARALAVDPMAALKDSYHRPREPAIG